jgi:hypothetical protein
MVINASWNPLKKLLHFPPNVLETMQALPRPLLLEIDKTLPYKPQLQLLLLLQPRPSSYAARIAKTTMKPLLQEKNKLIYNVGTGLLPVMVESVLLRHP